MREANAPSSSARRVDAGGAGWYALARARAGRDGPLTCSRTRAQLRPSTTAEDIP